jgi:hypothetical protein
MNKTVIAVIAGIGLLIVGTLFAATYFSYSNQEVRLVNQLKAEQKNSQVTFDTTWKIIQQSFGVAESYKDGFKEVYTSIMEARYEGKNPLFNFVTESTGANFDPSVYATVQRQIESQRINFQNQQRKLIDLKREHDNLLTVFPSSLFVGGRPEFEIQIVTSSKTEKAFSTGREDDISMGTTK